MTDVSWIQYINEGMAAALVRADRYGLEPSEWVFELTREALVSVIAAWPGELHERFISLFAENVTVAAIARDRLEHGRIERRIDDQAYREDREEGEIRDPFEEGELLAFLAHSTVFFNSFTHRHGDG